MTSENLEDKYPHWKDALFGNHNAVANLRCAAHYVFWHGVYALLAVIGVLVVGAIKAGKFVAQYLGPLAAPTERFLDGLFSRISYVLNHEYTKKVGDAVFLIAAVGLLVGIVGAVIYFLVTAFWQFLAAVGGGLGVVALLIGLALLWEKLRAPAKSAASGVAAKANVAGQKAVQTPGVRRVYGECPVSLEQAPHWFENLFPEDDEL